MTTLEFVSTLLSRNVRLWAEGERLRYSAPKGTLTQELLAELAQRKREILTLLRPGTVEPIPRIPRNAPLPLSFAQQRLWFLDQLVPHNPFYNVPAAIRLQGPLNLDALTRTINEIVRRHEVLRTIFLSVDGKPVLQVAEARPVPLSATDLREVAQEQRLAECLQHCIQESRRPFQLDQGPLLRFHLFQLGMDDHVLLSTMHHIVSDGWSRGVLIHEATVLYDAFSKNCPSPLADLPIQYVDFAAWQRKWLSGEILENQLAYWKKQLADLPELRLATDHRRPAMQTFRGGTVRFELSSELSDKIRALGRENDATLFMVLLAGFKVLLYRHTHQPEIVVGSVIANRNRAEIESLIGFFVNTLILRTPVEDTWSFLRLLRSVREVTLDAYTHQDLPFELLVNELQPERDLSRNPMMQIGFVVQNAPEESLKLSDLKISPLHLDIEVARSDLEFNIWDDPRGINGCLIYSTELFEGATIERLLHQYRTILAGIVENPQQRIADLTLLTPTERQQLLVEWNETAIDFESAQCVHEMFEKQVRENPDAIVACFEEEQLTYYELDVRANQLARHLQLLGVVPEVNVGICVSRSLEMLLGLLGILKAGGAYVPLDPEYPRQRLEFMLQDARVPVLVTEQSLAAKVPLAADHVVILDADGNSIQRQSGTRPASHVVPSNTAAVIYTSGSTGQPKGVSVQHRGLCNMADTMSRSFGIQTTSHFLQFGSLSFDASIGDICIAIRGRATIFLSCREALIPGLEMVRLMREKEITHVVLPPSALRAMPDERLPALEVVASAGEACSAQIVERWSENRRFVNAYGPTEASVCASLTDLPHESGAITIGRPIANAQIYILGPRFEPVPVGVTGEIFLGGLGLCRGYLRRPDLTAEKFIPHPWSTVPGGRFFRSGDLGSFLADGHIQFLGRGDQQVKVRGFRIEPGEIQSLLAQHPSISEAYVVTHQTTPGDTRLVAYVVQRQESGGSHDEFLANLRSEEIASWQSVFDDPHVHDSGELDPADDFRGWNSSYTGEPIPLHEMQDWRDQAVDRILALRPRRLLEIGCGSGLLLFRVAPHCAEYWGSDFSKTALERVRARISSSHDSAIRLLQRWADDFSDLAAGSFDTIVLNSVIQYFPDIEYLLKVLRGAVSLAARHGKILIGDVRSLPLLQAFHTSVQFHQAHDETSTEELVHRVQQRMLEEEELLVDPAFFEAFAEQLRSFGVDRCCCVEIVPKRAKYRNELSSFRYDVVLHLDVEADRRNEIVWKQWPVDEPSLSGLRKTLEASRGKSLGMHAIPNARLGKEMEILRQLAAQNRPQKIGDIRKRLGSDTPAIDPGALWALAEELHCFVDLSWAQGGSDGAFDAVFRSRDCEEASAKIRFPRNAALDHRPWRSFANAPLRRRISRQLTPVLRDYLAERVPEYMIPAWFEFIDEIPLLPNGKTDRKALPLPDAARTLSANSIVIPRTETERRLVGIWLEVLGIDRVGIFDNFFHLGGHSLLATQLVSRVRDAFQVEMPLRALFENPTVAGLADRLPIDRSIDASAAPQWVETASSNEALPLSFAQQRLWFLHELEPESTAYNIVSGIRLRGRLAVGAFHQTMNEIVRRHTVLRTRFVSSDGRPVQIVDDAGPVNLAFVDLASLPSSERELELHSMAAQASSTPFELSRGPLLRAVLVRLDAADHVVLISMHHIISDGWSVGVFIRELSRLYSEFVFGRPSPLPELPIQYADFATWQRKWLSGDTLATQLAYWREQLRDAPTLAITTDHPRPSTQTFNGEHLFFELSSNLSQALRRLGAEQGATIFMTLLAAFDVLLQRYTSQDDIVVGTPIANRNRREIESLIGFFVNVIALRCNLSGGPTFQELLQQVRETALGSYAHQDIPFEQLVEEIQPERDLSRTPIFQVLFAVQNAPGSELVLPGLQLLPLELSNQQVKFDLEVYFEDLEERLCGCITYNTDLFDRSTIQQLAHHYVRVLEAVAANPSCPITDLPIVDESEQRQMLIDWNNTSSEFDRGVCVHEFFEAQVNRTPDQIALVWQDGHVSYRELNARANRLAHHLRSMGVSSDTRVAVCVERSLEMVAAVLAILKAGGVYVPLDPTYPSDRLQFMLTDSTAKALITQQGLLPDLHRAANQPVLLDVDGHLIAGRSSRNLFHAATAENLVYLIYTSGSTGQPKGSGISHRSLVNLLAWQMQQLPSPRRTLQFTSLSFDVSFQEIFSTLCAGGSLVLVADESRRDPMELIRLLNVEQVERLFMPFVALQHVCGSACESGEFPTALREVITAGEQLRVTREVAEFFTQLSDVAFYNHYGPSESHVVTSFSLDGKPETWSQLPPIGRPISNSRIYLLDSGLRPVPRGVPGELYIGGECLAHGYSQRPHLTAERFLPNPHGPFGSGMRMYKTGDLARYLPDGNIQFLGRVDHQVKIRGFRVELDEIENLLMSHSAVREAVVVARELPSGDQRLIAYFVGKPGADVRSLRRYLAEKLPSYMIPADFVALEQWPLTPSGKVNRRLLPAPQQPEEKEFGDAPRTHTEEIVAGIWCDVLGIENVGRNSNFFELGGHSIIATQVASRIRGALSIELPLRSIFAFPTVSSLAASLDDLIRSSRKSEIPRIDRIARDGHLPLSFAQKRLWFLDQLERNSASYNLFSAIRARGQLDATAAEQALAEIVRRHQALRTVFSMIDGEPRQVICRSKPVKLPIVDLSQVAEPQQQQYVECLARAHSQRPFDLSAGPLLRVMIIRCSQQEHVLLFCMHHIVFDGWSFGVFVREWLTLYQALRGGLPSGLAELPVQYGDYAAWQQQWLTQEKLEIQLSYWRSHLSGAPPALEFPTDYPRPTVHRFRGASQEVLLSRRLSDALKALSRREDVTLFMTLLAAFKVLLKRYAGQSDIVVGTPVAGRNWTEIEDLIGFFVNTLVLRTDLSNNPTFRELLGRVREVTHSAYVHQETPFEKLVDALGTRRDLGRTPLFQVMFALQNTPTVELALAGVELRTLPITVTTSRFDLTFSIADAKEGLAVSVEYNTDLFERDTILRLLRHYETLLTVVSGNPDVHIDEVRLLTAAERARQLLDWNGLGATAEWGGSLVELFEQQVARRGEAVALVFGQEQVSYGELDRRANRVAWRLSARGVRAESIVGVCVERSVEMVVGLLGVLKAGGAYLPLDPALPPDRLGYMLSDSGAQVVVTTETLSTRLGAAGVDVLRLEEEEKSKEERRPAGRELWADNLAYVIYTSGSTGQPKGTLVSHRHVLRLFGETAAWFQFGAEDVWTLFHSYAFDFSVWELWGALLFGGRLVIVPYGTSRSPREFQVLVAREQVTVLNQTPRAFRQFMEADESAGSSRLSLRHVIFGGEALRVEELRSWYARHPAQPRLCNMYGITETTVHVTYRPLSSDDTRLAGRSPIGRPIPDLQVYILDGNLEPVPVGVAGELHVSGGGVSRGYVGRPDQTAQRMIAHPYARRGGGRLYRTGDRARFAADGQIEYLGRVDRQLKIRGYRIEPGEIEAVLSRHPQVRQCVVQLREDVADDQRLVAYVVLRVGGSDWSSELRRFVERQLPSYMIPHRFVCLEQLPLTAHGKLDRAALPAPQWSSAGPASVSGPLGEMERLVASIWEAVLRVEGVGREQNFFELGGHSLLLVQVQNQLTVRLGREVAMVDLFRFPTVATLSRFLTEGAAVAERPAEPRARPGSLADSASAIAIIGMSGRFPGAGNVEAFWQNLSAGVESITFFSDEELRAAGVPEELLQDPQYVKARGMLREVEQFDAAFFGYSPREAEIIDPQQRLFLECAWEALEAAGYDASRERSRIGLYAGSSLNTYYLGHLYSRPEVVERVGAYPVFLANDKDFLCTRVSYKLNLRGPSVTLQTACSTSLVAVHHACRSLLSGDCDLVLAGGVSVSAREGWGYRYEPDGIASSDGHCRAFDSRAGGTVDASGVGVVVLKRLADALRDRDPIEAVLLGTAVNNDGNLKAGYTAPSVAGQAEVIGAALQSAGVSADTIGYVEAHGTGTALGDPIEVAALRQVFGSAPPGQPYCGLGSVKTNIGHLDTAAGVAGLIKTVLCLKHRQLPASLHFERPNPQIDFESSPFYVPTRLAAWEERAWPRRAGVSSFGIGGTNAHVIVQEAPAAVPSGPSREWQLLPLSAKTPEALATYRRHLSQHLRSQPELNLADVCYTLQVGRRAMPHRCLVLCQSVAEAAQQLESPAGSGFWTGAAADQEPEVVFLFPGQAAQHEQMGRDLYQSEAEFRLWIDRCAAYLEREAGLDLRELLCTAAGARALEQTRYAQPALFALEYALARLWMSWGVWPRALLGHSLGEYVAACLAEVFTLEDGLRLVARRGELMQQQPPGQMLAVGRGVEEVAEWLADHPQVTLAAVNGPGQCVVSGPEAALAAWAQGLSQKGVLTRCLATSHAFHSPLMQPVAEQLLAELRSIELSAPRIPYLSCLTGQWIRAEEATDPAYWSRQLQQPVQFQRALAQVLEASPSTPSPPRYLLEVGPGNTLSHLAGQQGGSRPGVRTWSTLGPAPGSSSAQLLRTVGHLWSGGVGIDWSAFAQHETRRRVPLPTYPFQRQAYWITPSSSPSLPLTPSSPSSTPSLDDWFYAPSWKQALLCPATHTKRDGETPSYLLFLDQSGLGAKIASELRGQGYQVVTVTPSRIYERRDEHSYTIGIENCGDYDALISDLRSRDKLPTDIIHLWSFGSPDAAAERASFATIQNHGFYSLLWLAKSLGTHAAAQTIRIHVISSAVHAIESKDQCDPERATILGPCKVIPQEYSNITCCNIDLADDFQSEPGLIRKLIAELTSPVSDRVVGYRGCHRWVRDFQPLSLKGTNRSSALIRQRGVYLLTGGLGDIGLDLAEYLVKTAQARLILTGRSQFPPREEWDNYLATNSETDRRFKQIQRLRAIEALGGEVSVLCADVSNDLQMREVVKQAREKFDGVHGIIHAAGIVTRDSFTAISETDEDACLRHFVPKVFGLQVLGKIVGELKPDFCLLLSSISSLLGGLGMCAYAAANAFMDAFAQSMKTGEVTSWTSINWSETESAAEAAEVLSRVLANDVGSQIVFSRTDLQGRINKWVQVTGAAAAELTATSARAERSLKTSYVPPGNIVEERLATIWEEQLGIRAGVHDDFFVLGGDSLLATQLLSKIRAEFDLNLPLRAIFESPTVAAMAVEIESMLVSEAQTLTDDELLQLTNSAESDAN